MRRLERRVRMLVLYLVPQWQLRGGGAGGGAGGVAGDEPSASWTGHERAGQLNSPTQEF